MRPPSLRTSKNHVQMIEVYSKYTLNSNFKRTKHLQNKKILIYLKRWFAIFKNLKNIFNEIVHSKYMINADLNRNLKNIYKMFYKIHVYLRRILLYRRKMRSNWKTYVFKGKRKCLLTFCTSSKSSWDSLVHDDI